MKKGNEAETRLRWQGGAAAVAEFADDLMELELAWQVPDGMAVTFDDLRRAGADHYGVERIKPFFRDQDIERQEREIEARSGRRARMAQAHREAVQTFFAARGIATRKQAKRLYVVRKGRWNGCAAYVEFEDPNTTAWAAAGLWQGCRLKVIPLDGARNWDYCRRVEAEIRAALDGEAAA